MAYDNFPRAVPTNMVQTYILCPKEVDSEGSKS